MWNKVEFDHKPNDVDENISSKYVYVRKNIKETTKDDMSVWECLEQKVLKADWETYQTILTNSDGIDGLGEMADTNATAIDDIGELLATYEEMIATHEERITALEEA